MFKGKGAYSVKYPYIDQLKLNRLKASNLHTVNSNNTLDSLWFRDKVKPCYFGLSMETKSSLK